MNEILTWRHKLTDYLSLERNVAIASAGVFLLGLGEELWKKFLPKYLEALGAADTLILIRCASTASLIAAIIAVLRLTS